jgi:diaminopropionate ammonia-lyase
MRFVLNPLAVRGEYRREEAQIISRRSVQAAFEEICRWPNYAVTSLRSLPRLADELGIKELLYKDESDRLQQGSFKVLGGAYAATLQLRESGVNPATVTLCCATDGNHGRSVAYAAQRFGSGCVVFMHDGAPDEKARIIESLGASVVRLPGTYDDAVRHARLTAAEKGWVLVADTSDNPDDLAARRVLQGYGVMVLEILQQRVDSEPFTHVLLQGGVGGLAAAVAGMLAEVYGEHRPRIIVVEPHAAACLFESALRGVASCVGGGLVTAMAMLSCGEASPVAWRILKRRADAFMTITDEAAIDTALRLTQQRPNGEGLDVGVSGAAGVAGLLRLRKHEEFAAAVGLNERSRVLTFGTEEALHGP